MKKNLWILLVLSALIAMFVISGCQKAVTPTPTPTPTPTATAQPTPTPDVKCPEVVSTQVYKGYSDFIFNTGIWELEKVGLFTILITFNENIDPTASSCIYDTANWTVEVSNPGRKEAVDATVLATKTDGKKILVLAHAFEEGNITPVSYKFSYESVTEALYVVDSYTGWDLNINNCVLDYDNWYEYYGLICNSTDAKEYAKYVDGLQWLLGSLEKDLEGLVECAGGDDFQMLSIGSGFAAPKVADVVKWKLSSSCVIADELGNYCCGFSGEDCCLEPVCTTCADECPFETAGGTCIECTTTCE